MADLTTNRFARGLFALLLAVAATASPVAAQAADAGAAPVSREEYDALRREMLQMKKEMEAMRKAQAQAPAAAATTAKAPASAPAAGVPAATGTNAEEGVVASLRKDLETVKAQVEEGRLGETKFLLTGNASSGFTAPEHGSSNFLATFSPLLLWKLSDNLLVESEVEFELENSDTVTKLEYAQIAWTPLDFLTIGAGKFLNPMNVFVERYEPKWINKFPDTPLAVYDGILPESHVGAQARGGLPVGPVRFNYALYVGNGAELNSDAADTAGTLQFDNFTDTNNNKAVGGRIGFLPLPMLEVGYGFEEGSAGDPNGVVPDRGYLLQSADLDFSLDSQPLLGRVGLRGQYAWSNVDRATYDADGSMGYGPLSFANNRDGGYVQASYRPTHAGVPYLTDTEFLCRFDTINNPSGIPDVYDQNRWTMGLDYWFASATVLKLAYEFDNQDGGQDNNTFLMQAATGF